MLFGSLSIYVNAEPFVLYEDHKNNIDIFDTTDNLELLNDENDGWFADGTFDVACSLSSYTLSTKTF
jgi:hypothetical protein